MRRKSVSLICLFFLLGLVSNALALLFVPGQRWWSDAGDTRLWSDPCNW